MRTFAVPVLLTGLFLLTACQTQAGGAMAGDASGEVDLSDGHTRSVVGSVLAKAVGRTRVDIGPEGAGWTPVVTVLPPKPGPYETHSTVLPVPFDIRSRDGKCQAVRRDTGEAFALPGIRCQRPQDGA